MVDTRHDDYIGFPSSPYYLTIALGAGAYALAPAFGFHVNNSVVLIEVRADLYRSAGSDAGVLIRRAAFKLDTLGGTPSQVGSVKGEDFLDSDLAGATFTYQLATDTVTVMYQHPSASNYYMDYRMTFDFLGDAT